MFSKKKTECRVCGYRFTPERENIYTAEEPRSALEMLTATSKAKAVKAFTEGKTKKVTGSEVADE